MAAQGIIPLEPLYSLAFDLNDLYLPSRPSEEEIWGVVPCPIADSPHRDRWQKFKPRVLPAGGDLPRYQQWPDMPGVEDFFRLAIKPLSRGLCWRRFPTVQLLLDSQVGVAL